MYNTEFFRYLNQKVGYVMSSIENLFFNPRHMLELRQSYEVIFKISRVEFNYRFFFPIFFLRFFYVFFNCLDSMAQTLRNTCCNYAKYYLVLNVEGFVNIYFDDVSVIVFLHNPKRVLRCILAYSLL